MDLTEYVEALRHSLTTAAAAAGEQARETARLLADTMEPAVRLTVTDALAAMAAEVTAALDGALVDIRLRGRDPEVVVVPAEHAAAPGPGHADDDRRRRRFDGPHQPAAPRRAEEPGRGRGRGRRDVPQHLAGPRRRPLPLRDQPRAPPSGRGPRRYTGFARS